MKQTYLKSFFISSDSSDLKHILEKNNIIGIVEFSKGKTFSKFLATKNIPYIHIKIKPFSKTTYYEIFTSSTTVHYGKYNNIKYSYDGIHFFSALEILETENLEFIGKILYDFIFDITQKNSYQYISRIWNFIPTLNRISNNIEKYKSFCYGRSNSFKNNIQMYPAATGIGNIGNKINIYFLAIKNNLNINIENPNQTPAYLYPKEYGIKSPNFSRAVYLKYNKFNSNLFISGTASIIGFKSIHNGNIQKQCTTAIQNLQTLISKTNLEKYNINNSYSLDNMDCIKVYIKNSEDYPIVKNICDKYFPKNKSIMFLHSDICRKDLLVEIEGIISNVIT